MRTAPLWPARLLAAGTPVVVDEGQPTAFVAVLLDPAPQEVAP